MDAKWQPYLEEAAGAWRTMADTVAQLLRRA
jgi:hypothetical protein